MGWNLDTVANSLTVTAASNTTPIQITTSTAHGLANRQSVFLASVGGNTAANGTWVIDVTGANTFTLSGSAGNGAFTTGGTVSTGMFYTSGLTTDGYGTGINFGAGVEKEVSIPIQKRKVVAGDVGKMFVMKSTSFPTKNSGCFKITAINVGNNTTIASGSNGQSLPQSTINVVSTTGFPTSGTIFVTTSTGSFAVTYTNTNATQFTGCSGGSGTMSTGGAVSNLNRYVLDYRSTENPPVETINSINWWLYEIETTASNFMSTFVNNSFTITGATNASPIVITPNPSYSVGQKVVISGITGNTAANGVWTVTPLTASTFALNGSTGNGTYGGGGSVRISGYPGDSVTQVSRITLQSPHSIGWQVRLAVEPTISSLPLVSITTGFNADGYGDFIVGGSHNHVALFFDIDPLVTTAYGNLITGGGHPTTASRITMAAESSGQYVVVYTRTLGGTNNGFIMFGLPDSEPTPLPTLNVERLFCYAGAPNTDFGAIILRTGVTNNVGFTFKNGIPDFCALSSWANLDGTSATNPLLSANAGDSPFTGTTEILPVEIWGGIATEIALTAGSNPPFAYNQRFMGLAPITRNGRTNFGTFTLSTEEVTTRTITAATNASPIQITTGVANALVTGQVVTISGVLGNTAANGTWVITVINSTTFTLNGSTGNGVFVGATTIASGSNGATLPQATINVVSTTGFPTSGSIYVTTSTGVSLVNYTGTNATQFTGCTSGTGVMSTGGAVTTGIDNGCPRFIHLQNGIYLQWNGASGLTP